MYVYACLLFICISQLHYCHISYTVGQVFGMYVYTVLHRLYLPYIHVYTYLHTYIHLPYLPYVHEYTYLMYMYIHTCFTPVIPALYTCIYIPIHINASAIPALCTCISIPTHYHTCHIYICHTCPIYTCTYIPALHRLYMPYICMYTHFCFTSAIPAQECTCQTVYTYQPNSLPDKAPIGAIS